MTKTDLKELLHSGVCEVTFTKVDGSVRIMPCTLAEALLPAVTANETKRIKVPNEANLSVWCTDKNEWRSFKVANVTAIKLLS